MGNVSCLLAQFMYPEEQVLWHAAKRGEEHVIRETLRKLDQNGSTTSRNNYLEWQEPCTGRTAVAEAAASGNLQCLVALLQAGANCLTRDHRGNTPLHLASKNGHQQIIEYLVSLPMINALETNHSNQTPLDLARKRYHRHKQDDRGIDGSIEALEKKLCIYSGWLYEKTDNLVSMVSGMPELNSWHRRFCLVLQHGDPSCLELSLFATKPGQMRPIYPTERMIYEITAGMERTSDNKWFNKKEFAFRLQGRMKRQHECHMSTYIQKVEFAAVDGAGYQAWTSFFKYQQQQRGQVPVAAVVPQFVPQVPVRPAPNATTSSCCNDASRSSSGSSIATSTPSSDSGAELLLEEQEEADFQRAMELSLAQTSISEGAQVPTQEKHTPSPGSLPQHYSRAPSYMAIGECVVCFDGPQSAVCVPCGHNAVCMDCAEEILETSRECPVCRASVREIIKLYRV